MAAVVLACLVVGCADRHGQAVDRATAQVRASAHGARQRLGDLLAAPDAPPGGPVLLDYVRRGLPSGPDFAIFFSGAPDGGVLLRVAITGKGSDNGGIGGVGEEFVRLCVELAGRRSPSPAAELRDTACDADAVRRAEPDARQDVRIIVTLS